MISLYAELKKRYYKFREYECFKRQYTNDLKRFKDIHRGERCFIIGNGPSLLSSDLDKLKNEITFGSNYVFKIFDKTDWRPTYYSCTDGNVLKKIIKEDEFWNIGAKSFFFQYATNYLFNKKTMDNSYYFWLQEKKPSKRLPKFSQNIEKEVYNSWTVTYVLMQLAVYMGIKEIYLLGIDNNYSVQVNNKGEIKSNNNVQDSFVKGKSYKDLGGATPNVERMNMGYLSAKKFADKHNIKIYNATRGGKLEAYERINFDHLF